MSKIAYKFRRPDQMSFICDIIFNRRLHRAELSTLNDPMEGIFAYGTRSGGDHRPWVEAVGSVVASQRICSLCMTYDSHLLWAHYAAGFSGVAIEVALPATPEIQEVSYGGVFAYLDFEANDLPAEAGRKVLLSKGADWAYEKELRVLTSSTWFELERPIRRIILGHRMHPALQRAFRVICEHEGIEVNRTGIGDEGIDADRVPSLAEEDGRALREGTNRGR